MKRNDALLTVECPVGKHWLFENVGRLGGLQEITHNAQRKESVQSPPDYVHSSGCLIVKRFSGSLRNELLVNRLIAVVGHISGVLHL